MAPTAFHWHLLVMWIHWWGNVHSQLIWERSWEITRHRTVLTIYEYYNTKSTLNSASLIMPHFTPATNPCCKMRIWGTSILSSICTCKLSSVSGSTGSSWLILLSRCPISAAQLSTPPRSSSIFSRLPGSSVVFSAVFVFSSPSYQQRAGQDVHSYHLPTALLHHSHHLGHFPASALNRDQRRNKCQTYW